MARNIDLEALCNQKGLRITEQRRVIARVLSEAEDHPDVEKVYARASAVDPGISIATVYRTVRLFEEAGILDRHDFGDGRARYEPAPEAHHDHLIDVETGKVIEFVDPELEQLQKRSPRSSASAWSITGWSSTACRSTARFDGPLRAADSAWRRASRRWWRHCSSPCRCTARGGRSACRRRGPASYSARSAASPGCAQAWSARRCAATPSLSPITRAGSTSSLSPAPPAPPSSPSANWRAYRWSDGCAAQSHRLRRPRRPQCHRRADRRRPRRARHRLEPAIFPEGTTGDGAALLPFKAPLLSALDPAPTRVRVQPVWIDYGEAMPAIAWLGDEPGLANVRRILARPGRIAATLHMLEPFDPGTIGNRKAIAAEARARIEAAASASRKTPPPVLSA